MADDPLPAFGDMLRAARRAAGLTHEQLAERAGLSVRGISDLERGIVRAPRKDTFDLLVNALNLSTDERKQWEHVRKQLARRAGRRDDPVPSSASATLPTLLTSLVGRERDIREVTALLRQPGQRLVTITGTGGTGKTRLALAVANAVQDDYADGVSFVPLAAVTDPHLVVPILASALGVATSGGQPIADALVASLRNKHMLLVIDNVEQVVEGAVSILSDIVAGCPRISLIVTSRVPMHVVGEQEYPLAPLELPDLSEAMDVHRLARVPAVRLFVERAQAIVPTFTLTDANASVIAVICHRLDGLPLAIELAASRIRLFPPATLLQQLDQRFSVLVSPLRDVPARHKTLRDTVAWSYDLLSPDEQQLYRTLSIFRGGWTLDAMLSITPDTRGEDASEIDIISLLEHLIDHHLVRVHEQSDGTPRYSMLETIREFAEVQLDASGERAVVQSHHAGFFVELAERAAPALRGPDEEVWVGRLNEDRDNLRAALDWAIGHDDEIAVRFGRALWTYWVVHSPAAEARRWLKRIVSCTTSPLLVDDPTILSALGAFTYFQSDYEEAQTYFGAALKSARARNDASNTAWSLHGLGRTAFETGDIEEAERHYHEALSLYRDLDDHLGIADMLNVLGVIAMDVRGDYEQASTFFSESLSIRRTRNDLFGICQSVANLGCLTMEQGDHEAARRFFEESLARAQASGDQLYIANELRHLGALAIRRHDRDRAVELLCQSIDLYHRISIMKGIVQSFVELIRMYADAQEYERAAVLTGAAEALSESIRFRLPDRLRLEHDRIVADVREHLREDRWFSCWARGRAMRLKDVMADVISLVDTRGDDARRSAG